MFCPDFRYRQGQIVSDPLGNKGIRLYVYDELRHDLRLYFVQTAAGLALWAEDELRPVPEEQKRNQRNSSLFRRQLAVMADTAL